MVLKFIITFFAIGFIISLLGGIIAQNNILYILTVSAISGISMGGLGMLVFLILEKKIPEFFEIFGNSDSYTSGDVNFDDSAQKQSSFNSENDQKVDGEVSDGSENFPSTDAENMSSGLSPKDGKPQVTPENIVINDIVIKNEPKLMAEAIRTMMSTDDEEPG